jgi:hypothetical protein
MGSLTTKGNTMKSTKWQDYRIFETTNVAGSPRWEIRLGGVNGDRVTTCQTLETAQFQAEQLNIDPYYFERSATKKSKTVGSYD